MIELWKHLHREGRLGWYLKLLVWRHRRVLAYLFLSLTMVFALYTSTQRSLDRERDAQIKACERVQILRDQTNGLSLIAYDAWNEGAKRERALARTDSRQRSKHLESAHGYETLAQQMVVTGPTDCLGAVDHPDEYTAPAPEFVYANSERVRIVRLRSEDIIRKAREHVPLYKGLMP